MASEDEILGWVQAALLGSEGACESIYRSLAGRVTAYFLRSGFARPDADDLTQEAFLRAFRSLASYDPQRGRFSAWVAAIARNVARKQWHRRRDEANFDPELAEEMFAAADNPGETPEAREVQAAVRDCVASLEAELGRIVELRYVGGLTTRGIAEAAGIPEATVRLRLTKARTLLQRCLRGKGFLS